MSSKRNIFIAKYLSSSKDNWFANLEETTVLARKKFTCYFRPGLQMSLASVLYYLLVEQLLLVPIAIRVK